MKNFMYAKHFLKVNKITNLLCFLLLFSITAFCQKNKSQVLNTEMIVGKNLINSSEIIGTEFIFPSAIHEVFFDPEKKFATVQLKGRKNSGIILQYDLKNKKILWTKKIDYKINELLKFDTLLILNEYNEAYVIDNYTGINLSKVINYIYFANPDHNMGFAYLYLSSGDGYYTNDFLGIDLLKGKLVWKRNINRAYGWNDYFYLNDSTLMVVAAGLHTINMNTGEGWDYDAETGEILKPNYTNEITGAVVGAIIGGIIGGLIGGGLYYIPTYYAATATGNDVIRDLNSNTLMSGDFIYFASKEELVKINTESGNIVWKSTFSKDLAGKSSLFMDDTMVYMVNYGFAIRNNRNINYRSAFIAAFNKLTGKQRYIKLTNNANGIILDYKQIDNDIYLLFQNVIAKYSLETGNLISEKIFPIKKFGELKNFVDNNLYISNSDGYFFNLAQFLHINTAQEIIISVTPEINVLNTIKVEDTGINYLDYKEYQFIAKDEKTFVIDHQGKTIIEFDISSNAFIFDDILYDKRKESIITIDLKNNALQLTR